MISFEYLPNEGGLTGLMAVPAPSQSHAHTWDLNSAAQHSRKDGNLGKQAAGGNLSPCACWFMQGGKRKGTKMCQNGANKGTIWLWGDLGSSKQHQDRHPQPARPGGLRAKSSLAWFGSHTAEHSWGIKPPKPQTLLPKAALLCPKNRETPKKETATLAGKKWEFGKLTQILNEWWIKPGGRNSQSNSRFGQVEAVCKIKSGQQWH